MIDKIKNISIDKSASIVNALKQMDVQKCKLLIVLQDDKFFSLLSIGDIQRAIIDGVTLNSAVENILRKNVRVVSVHDNLDTVKETMKEKRNDFMPVLDDENNITDVIFWEDLFDKKRSNSDLKLNLPVVIMAGGQGSRLRPLTNILPKPLIPIGKQTIIEDIMDRFVECGCSDFHISVNYKADIIKWYFDNLNNSAYHVSYFQEDKPLGTAGSLHLLKDKIKSTFFVSNCDIIIDQDYGDILNYHKQNGNEITVVAAIKNLLLPYGTLETKELGLLKSIHEKPDFTFKINTGFYILEPHLIKEIPEDRFFHITNLIENLCNAGRKVGVYPINEGSWTDVGNWEEYMKQFVRV